MEDYRRCSETTGGVLRYQYFLFPLSGLRAERFVRLPRTSRATSGVAFEVGIEYNYGELIETQS